MVNFLSPYQAQATGIDLQSSHATFAGMDVMTEEKSQRVACSDGEDGENAF